MNEWRGVSQLECFFIAHSHRSCIKKSESESEWRRSFKSYFYLQFIEYPNRKLSKQLTKLSKRIRTWTTYAYSNELCR